MVANTGRDQAGRWRKGQSGNPAGKPKGTRHQSSLAAEMLLDGEAEALTRAAVTAALRGDIMALRICLDRILPPRKERTVSFELPKMASAHDAIRAAAAIMEAVAAGELTPGEAAVLGRLVESYVRALEVADLEARLEALETAYENQP